MPAHKHSKTYNENWESEIAAYDEECRRAEDEFYRTHVIITESGSPCLTAEENEILILYLNGVSCKEISRQYRVDEAIVKGLIEIIRAKLSVSG